MLKYDDTNEMVKMEHIYFTILVAIVNIIKSKIIITLKTDLMKIPLLIIYITNICLYSTAFFHRVIKLFMPILYIVDNMFKLGTRKQVDEK